MIIIVDGYNVLKQGGRTSDISKKERIKFISQLTKYARSKNHRIVLVFDGGHYVQVHKEKVGAVEVFYSGMRKSADDVIKQYINTHNVLDLLLVTSDRELNRHASRLGIVSIDSHHFSVLLQEGVHTQEIKKKKHGAGHIIKMTDSVNPELDELMAESVGNISIKQADIVNYDEIDDQRKLGKKDRTLFKKLKKL